MTAKTCAGLAGLLALAIGSRPAQAADLPAASPGDLPLTHRVSVAVMALSGQSWGAVNGGGPGMGAALGYDLFFAGRHGVGVVLDTAVEFGSYGGDKDAMSWRELGLRYTYARAFIAAPRLTAFASLGATIGRTGGEAQRFQTMGSLMADLGLDCRLSGPVSVAVRLSERPGRIAWPWSPDPWWHNTVGGMLELAVRLGGGS